MELGCLYMNVTFDLLLNTECVLLLTEFWGKNTSLYIKIKDVKEK